MWHCCYHIEWSFKCWDCVYYYKYHKRYYTCYLSIGFQNTLGPVMGLYSSVFGQDTHIGVDCWNNNSGTAGIDWVGFGNMVQFVAGSGSVWSGHIRDMLLGLMMSSVGFSKVDVCFWYFCLDFLKSVGIWWLFFLAALKVSKVVTFCFLFVNIDKLGCSGSKQKKNLLNIT